MGVFYIVVAAPILINLLRSGYWSGMIKQLPKTINKFVVVIISIIILVLCIIKFVDFSLSSSLKSFSTHNPQFNHYWEIICSCGDGGVIAGSVFTIFMLAKQFNLNKLSEVAKISLMSSIFGGLLNGVFKFIFNRQRPSIGLDPFHFFAFFRSNHPDVNDLMYAFNSMPSGHTISIASAVIPFVLAYKNKFLRSGLFFVWILIACARVYTLNHWFSDVMVASLFGFLIGVTMYENNKWRINEK